MAAMRLIDGQDFQGLQKIRMLKNVVAGGRPVSVGDVISLPSAEAYELVANNMAEPYVEGPRIHLVG